MTESISSTSLYGTLGEFAARLGYDALNPGNHTLTQGILSRLGASASSPIVVYRYGELTNLSMNQLLMAVCLERGNAVELETISKMEKMTETTAKLKRLARLEEMILEKQLANASLNTGELVVVAGETPSKTVAEVLMENQIVVYGTNGNPMAVVNPVNIYGSDVANAARQVDVNVSGAGDIIGANTVAWFNNGGRDWLLSFGNGTNANTIWNAQTQSKTASGVLFPVTRTMAQALQDCQKLGVSIHCETSNAQTLNNVDYAKLLVDLESTMDSLNTVSHEDMIDLQSLVNKRDQAYTLLSNGSRLMSNLSQTIVNNI